MTGKPPVREAERMGVGATGIVEVVNVRLSPKQEFELVELLEQYDLSLHEEFCRKFENAIGMFLGMRNLAMKSSVGSVRKNLRECKQKATALRRAMLALDGNSAMIISKTGLRDEGCNNFQDFLALSSRILNVLVRAENHTRENLPASGGRRKETEKSLLVQLLRDSLRTYHDPLADGQEKELVAKLFKLSLSVAGLVAPRGDLSELLRHGYAEQVYKQVPPAQTEKLSKKTFD